LQGRILRRTGLRRAGRGLSDRRPLCRQTALRRNAGRGSSQRQRTTCRTDPRWRRSFLTEWQRGARHALLGLRRRGNRFGSRSRLGGLFQLAGEHERSPIKGEIKNFTGIDSPYERPETAELVLDTTADEPGMLADRIVDYLEAKGRLSSA
jgi:hypothetical protein